MTDVIEAQLYFGDGKTPNKNGRVYPLDVIKKSVDKLNEGKTYVTNEVTSFDPNIPINEQVEVGGLVKNAKMDDYKVMVQIQLTDNYLGKLIPVMLLGKHCKLVPTGTGDLEKVDGSDSLSVMNYNIVAVALSSDPAFEDDKNV